MAGWSEEFMKAVTITLMTGRRTRETRHSVKYVDTANGRILIMIRSVRK